MELHEAIAVLVRWSAGEGDPRLVEEAGGLVLQAARKSARRYVRGEELCEEIASRVVETLLTRGGPAQPLRSAGRARGYIDRVARSRATDYWRRQGRRKTFAFSDATPPEEQEPLRRTGKGEGEAHERILETPEDLREEICADLRQLAVDCDESGGRRKPIAQTVEDLIGIYVTGDTTMDQVVAREHGLEESNVDTLLRNRLEQQQRRARMALLDTLVAKREQHLPRDAEPCPGCGVLVATLPCDFCRDREGELPACEPASDLYGDPGRFTRLKTVVEHLKRN